MERILTVELLVIDLETCLRCVPTGEQLRAAVTLLTPVAKAMDIEIRYKEIIAQTPAEAIKYALISSPTIRLNGSDIAQDIRESVCESCGDLTNNNTSVECREWHYRGKTYSAAPLPMLVEVIMNALLHIDELAPSQPKPLKKLPENLERYFADKKKPNKNGCCGC
jgi:hypothetical protein